MLIKQWQCHIWSEHTCHVWSDYVTPSLSGFPVGSMAFKIWPNLTCNCVNPSHHLSDSFLLSALAGLSLVNGAGIVPPHGPCCSVSVFSHRLGLTSLSFSWELCSDTSILAKASWPGLTKPSSLLIWLPISVSRWFFLCNTHQLLRIHIFHFFFGSSFKNDVYSCKWGFDMLYSLLLPALQIKTRVDS